MSFVVVPNSVSEAARTLAGIRSELTAASTAAAVSTTGVAAAAADEISIAIAGVFGSFGQEFQALSAEAQAFHQQFVGTLTAGLAQYLSAEAANVPSLLGMGNSAAVAAASVPVLNYQTPLGPITLTLYGNQVLTTVNVTGGSLQVPTPLALAFDALGPEANVLFALRDSNSAFVNAVQTGNALAAAQTLIKAPVNAVTSFFVGQQSIAGSEAVPSETGYTTAFYSIPLDGLLAPVQPVTFGLIGEDGVANQFPLTGTEFGGLLPAIGGLLARL
jgi:hypothetical protein